MIFLRIQFCWFWQVLIMMQKNISEIMGYTGLKRSAVLCYLPYTKAIYKADELSTDAERIRLFRMRQKRCQTFMIDIAAMSDEEAEA